MGPLGAYFGSLGGLFWASWGLLRASWGLLGASWGQWPEKIRSGTPSGPPLGTVLGASYAVLETSWVVLGPSGGPLGPSWGGLGASWAVLWRSWELVGKSWGVGELKRRESKQSHKTKHWKLNEFGLSGPSLEPWRGASWGVLEASWAVLGASSGGVFWVSGAPQAPQHPHLRSWFWPRPPWTWCPVICICSAVRAVQCNALHCLSDATQCMVKQRNALQGNAMKFRCHEMQCSAPQQT